MQKFSNKYEQGFAHVLAIVFVVVIIGALGFVGVRSLNKHSSIDDRANEAARMAANRQCIYEYDDEDLCKFLSSWNANQKYKLESTTTVDGQASASMMAIDGDNSYFKMDGDYSMEVITIGDVTYTKAGETWWKQTAEEVDEPDSIPSKDDFKFEEPEVGSEEVSLTKYVKVGEEACGSFNCFKYQVVDSSDSETTEYIWFDDKDYLIRRTLSEGSDGYKSESVFSYDDISVSVPSPVQELGPNQYIIPGQSEPQTMPDMPSEADLEALMQQYGM